MFNAYAPCSSTSSNNGLTNAPDAIELTKDYFQSKDKIYATSGCDSNCTDFIEMYKSKYPHLLQDIHIVNLFFATWTQNILGAYKEFACHAFLIVRHDNQWHALDYDLQKFFGRGVPLDKISGIDYLARILNTDLTVAHLNELVSTPNKKSNLLPLFRVFTLDEWDEFRSNMRSSISGIWRKRHDKYLQEGEKSTDFNKIPVINFYEFFQFLKGNPSTTDSLRAQYNNSGYTDDDEALANARLDSGKVSEFLTLLRKYPSIHFNYGGPRLVPALDRDDHTSKNRVHL